MSLPGADFTQQHSMSFFRDKAKEVEAAVLSIFRGDVSAYDGSRLTDTEVSTLARCLENSAVLKPVVSVLQKDLNATIRKLKQSISRNRPGSARNRSRLAKKKEKEEKMKVVHKQTVEQLRKKHSDHLKKLETKVKTLRQRCKETNNKLKAATAHGTKARARCVVEGCYNVARGRTKKCIGHGGGPRCTIEGCNSGALSATLGYCGKHAVAEAKDAIVCSKCQKEFKSLEGLRSHTKNKVCERIAQAAESTYKYTCDLCPRKFKSSQGLAYHKKVLHEGDAATAKRKMPVYEATKLLENIKKAKVAQAQQHQQQQEQMQQLTNAPNAVQDIEVTL